MFAWPLPYTHTLTSTFGTRWGRLHGGLDISDGGVYGQPIYASASGTVTFSGGDNSGYGNYVIIDHGSGYTTLYGHCSSLVAVTGQYVNQGRPHRSCRVQQAKTEQALTSILKSASTAKEWTPSATQGDLIKD